MIRTARLPRSLNWVMGEMWSRGHEWTEETVWTVEQGTRRLTEAEATDLFEILDLNLIAFACETPMEAANRMSAFVFTARGRAKEAIAEWLYRKSMLERSVDWTSASREAAHRLGYAKARVWEARTMEGTTASVDELIAGAREHLAYIQEHEYLSEIEQGYYAHRDDSPVIDHDAPDSSDRP